MNSISINDFKAKTISLNLICKDGSIVSREIKNDSISFGTHGELIIITEPFIDKKIGVEVNASYEDSNFITLPKTDAQNILSMLNYAISKLESETREDNDIKVFGTKAISYKRLVDRLNQTMYGSLNDFIKEGAQNSKEDYWNEYEQENINYTQKLTIDEDTEDTDKSDEKNKIIINNHNNKFLLEYRDEHEKTCFHQTIHASVTNGMHRELMIISNPGEGIPTMNWNTSYVNSPFINIHKIDALNIIKIIDEYIKLKNGEDIQNIKELYSIIGPEYISYEILLDKIHEVVSTEIEYPQTWEDYKKYIISIMDKSKENDLNQ